MARVFPSLLTKGTPVKKTLAYLMVLVVGAAVLPSLGCSKSDSRKAAAKRLVGVWTGK